jgi:CRP-like cAMP-binding protein
VTTLTKHLADYWNITEGEAKIFLAAFDEVTLRKGDTFASPGVVCNRIGLVKSGLMKCALIKDGEEVIFEFAYENSFIADYYSFVTGTASNKSIVCLERTTVLVITRAKLADLGRQYGFIERISRITNEQLFIKMHEKATSLLLDSATVRYQKLVAARQDIAQRIPQYLLASYLNVTPETISRIRRHAATSTS